MCVRNIFKQLQLCISRLSVSYDTCKLYLNSMLNWIQSIYVVVLNLANFNIFMMLMLSWVSLIYATTMTLFCWTFCPVKSRFIWIYASFQFALVVLFAHIFYSLVTDFYANYILITCAFHLRKILIMLILDPDSIWRIPIHSNESVSKLTCTFHMRKSPT